MSNKLLDLVNFKTSPLKMFHLLLGLFLCQMISVIKHFSNIVCCWNSMGSHTQTITEAYFYYFRTGCFFSIYFSTQKLDFQQRLQIFSIPNNFCRSFVPPQHLMGLVFQERMLTFSHSGSSSSLAGWLASMNNFSFTPIRNKNNTLSKKQVCGLKYVSSIFKLHGRVNRAWFLP